MVCMVPKGCKTEMKQGMQHVLVNHTVWHTFDIIVFPTMAKKGIGGMLVNLSLENFKTPNYQLMLTAIQLIVIELHSYLYCLLIVE